MRYSRWDQVASTDETNSIARILAWWHLQQVASCEVRRVITSCILVGDFLSLVNMKLDYDSLSVPMPCIYVKCSLFTRSALT